VADLLLDTDVFVAHLRGSRALRIGTNRAHFSVITRGELLAGTSASDAVARLLQPFREVGVDRVVAERGADPT
jgi:predicted nucleic acid-binding protein